MAQSFYEVLGVSKSATKADIKSAYRRLALKWHPDTNKEAGATDKFKEITYAYEVLSNDEKKALYDQIGHDAFVRTGGKGGFGGTGAGGGWPGGAGAGGGAYQSGPFTWSYSSGTGGQGFEGIDPFEIFEQFFGGAASGFRQAAQKPTYQITLTFDEAVKGVDKEFSIDGSKKSVKIPAGVDTGTTIRFSDFNILVDVLPDKAFRREGQDVVHQVDLPFHNAILGTTVEVPTLEGKKLKVKVKPGTKHGGMLRLQGKGIKYPNHNRHGDMYIVFNITYPEKLSRKQKEALEGFN